MSSGLDDYWDRKIRCSETPGWNKEMTGFTEVTAKQVGGDHYQKAGSNMQPWDIARAWDLNGWEMNVLKYLLRHRYKNKKEDLEKAIHYLQYLIANYEDLYEPK